MIIIVKEGKKRFGIRCWKCGCEFTYERNDIFNDIVRCPCCSELIFHSENNQLICSEDSSVVTKERAK